MIRPFRAETERYGHYSVAGEYVYDRPFQWGSSVLAPTSLGGRTLLRRAAPGASGNPRDVVPESNMPALPGWIGLASDDIEKRMQVLRTLGALFG